MCLVVPEEDVVDKRMTEVKQVRHMNDNILRNIKASLQNRYWDILNTMTVNEGCELLVKEITAVMDFYAPEKNITTANDSNKKEPWFTKGLKKSSDQCQ